MQAPRDPLSAIRWESSRPVLTVVGCHAGGEIGNVIVDGFEPPPGESVFAQMEQQAAQRIVRAEVLHLGEDWRRPLHMRA